MPVLSCLGALPGGGIGEPRGVWGMGGDDGLAEEEDVQVDGLGEVIAAGDSSGVLETVPQYDPDEVAQYIYHLRCTGRSWTDIARSVYASFGWDISIGHVANLYKQFQASLAEAYGADGQEQLFQLENERLDAIQSAFWDDMLGGDVKAGRMVLDVMKHRAAINGFTQIDLRDRGVQNNILILGQDNRAWVEALAQHNTYVASGAGDDIDEEEQDE